MPRLIRHVPALIALADLALLAISDDRRLFSLLPRPIDDLLWSGKTLLLLALPASLTLAIGWPDIRRIVLERRAAIGKADEESRP